MIIAVFDDRKKDRDELVGIISSWAEEKGHADVIIRQFSTIDNLRFALEDYRQPDIFFLDIMTPENTSAGFVLAEHIHSVNPQASIIFTTNSREYISNAFEISAFRYLLKPLDAARVCSALDQLYLWSAGKAAAPRFSGVSIASGSSIMTRFSISRHSQKNIRELYIFAAAKTLRLASRQPPQMIF